MSCKRAKSELLIECVRKHDILYDTNKKEYSDAHLKIKLWEEITRECNFSSATETKNSWKNLRDGYRCFLKTSKSGKSGDAAKKTKPWKFAAQMSFLLPYMKDRPRSTNIACASEKASQLNETLTAVADIDDSMHDISSNEENDEVVSISYRPNSSLASTSKRKLQNQPSHSTPVVAKKSRHHGVRDEKFEFIKEQARKREERSALRQQNRVELLKSAHDSLKLFFDSMYEATKVLPILQQRQVRATLFNAVSAAEESVDVQSVGSTAPSTPHLIDLMLVTDSDGTQVSTDFMSDVGITN